MIARFSPTAGIDPGLRLGRTLKLVVRLIAVLARLACRFGGVVRAVVMGGPILRPVLGALDSDVGVLAGSSCPVALRLARVYSRLFGQTPRKVRPEACRHGGDLRSAALRAAGEAPR